MNSSLLQLGGAVVAFGNFDGVHLGHQHLLRTVCRIAQERDMISTILTFAPHPAYFFSGGIEEVAITSDYLKQELIAGLGIQRVLFTPFNDGFASLTATDFVQRILFEHYRARVLVVCSKCRFGHRRAGDVELLESLAKILGFELVVMDLLLDEYGHAYSSSMVREALKKGDINRANKILGRCYSVKGVVVHGQKRGRTIGFPTVNLLMEGLLKPLCGVYSARMTLEGECFYGVVNIGVRPTFSDGEPAILEMYVFDFDREIYGKEVTVELLGFIRKEKKFACVEQLVQQIKHDVSVVIGRQ